MIRKVVISAFLNQVLVGIVEDGRLAEFFIERDEDSRKIGNIYKGKVENILPGMGAAFIDLGLKRNGFLYVADLKSNEENQPINKILTKGQEIIVQVTKEPEGKKGARVENRISLPGRYLVLMPFDNNIGVSRQIDDSEERERLKEIGTDLCPPNMGLIIRTVAEGHSLEELQKDRDELVQLWEYVVKTSKQSSAPALLFHDHDLIYRIMRDLVNDDIDQIIVDQPWVYDKIDSLADKIQLSPKTKIELYDGEVALFDQLGLSNDLTKATQKRVWLNSGGYLIIDQTEALVSIDVNTGKYVGTKDLAQTVLQTNQEAAAEIAKQLRLRNLGGIIIIDFIDMSNRKDKRKVLETLEEALAKDKTKSQVHGFTQLGLVEMTRQKVKRRLSHLLQTDCSHCGGTGRLLSQETVAINLAQRIFSLAKEQDVTSVTAVCHQQVAASIIGPKQENLKLLKHQTGKEIKIVVDDKFELEQTEITCQ